MSFIIPSPMMTISPSVRGKSAPVMNGLSLGAFRLSTDPVGLVTLRFEGIRSGSELHVFYQDGTKAASIESTIESQQIVVQRFVYGAPMNTVRVLIASLGYENIDFSFDLPTTDSSVQVFQRIDRNYKNPL